MDEFKAKITAELDTSKVEQQLEDIKNKKINVKIDTGNADKNVNNVDKSIKNATQSTKSFGSEIKKSFNIGATINLTAKAFHAINTAARDAVKSVKEFDSSITKLRMATGGSYNDTRNLVKSYNQMGKTLGATTTEISDGADAWLRQGHSIKDTNTLIKDSMMLSKIANIDSAKSTEYLTSSMKGFKTSVEDVVGIVDKLTSVDLVSATDAAGLAEAMSRTAQTANNVGIPMEKLIGYLATIGEVTQKSMSSVGESMKTVFTRMENIKANKLEFIDEDGTTETLSDVELVLNNLGIKLRDSDNEFRNFGDVLDEVGGAWNNYSTVQQAAISKAFSGIRQSENFKVLMANYSKATSYMETAMNSAGTSEQKFEAYMDSLEAKTKTLQASFESLAVNAFSAELFGGIIEATTAVVEFLDKTNLLKGTLAGLATAGLVKTFTMLASSIAKTSIQMSNFGNAMSLLKSGKLGTDDFSDLVIMTENLSKSQLKAVLSSKSLTVQQRMAILTSRGMSEAEAEAILTSMGLATAEGAATATTFSLSAAIKGLWATLMANPLILVIAAVTAIVSAYSSYKQKLEETRQAALDSGAAAKDEAKSITDLYNAYSKANAAYASNKGSKEDLENATTALLSALGVEQSELDKLVDKYGDLDNAINHVTVDSLKTKLADLTSGYQASVETLLSKTEDGYFSSFSMLDFNHGKNGIKFADTLKDAGLIDSGSYGSGGGAIYLGDGNSINGAIESYQKLIDMRQALDEAVSNGRFTREELAQSNLYKGINDKINSVSKEYKDVLDYVKQINSISAEIQYMDFINDNGIPKTQKEFENLKKSMIDTASSSGEFVGSQKQIKDSVINTLSSMPELSKFFDNYSNSVEKSGDTTKITATPIQTKMKDLGTQTNSLIENISAVQAVLAKQSTGESLSIDDFNSDALKDYTSALEYNNGTLKLNAEKVNEIVKAKYKEQIATNNSNKALAQSKYLKNAGEIEKLRQKMKDKNFAEGESVDSIQKNIDSLLNENNTLRESCAGYDLITASLQEATSAYQNWMNSQNSSQAGDMFDDTLDAINHINDTLNNKESDLFGRIGRTDYKAAIDLIIPNSIDSSDAENVNSYLKSIQNLFTYNDDGERSGLNIENFCQKAVDKGLMVLDESSDSYKIAGQKTMQDFADGLRLSLPLVQAMFGEMEEYGGDFSWADEAVKTIGDLGLQANESAEALRKLTGNEDLTIKLDVSDIENTDDKISTLETTISEMNAVKAKPDVDASEIEYANDVIKYCIAQQQNLSAPIVMSVDTSAISENTANAIQTLQDFKRACNDLELNEKLGLDTTEAEQKVNTLAGQVKGIDATILTQLGIDTSSVESVKASIQNITGEQLISIGIDDSAIIGWTADNKTATVTYKKDSTEIDNYDPEDLKRKVTYTKISTEVDQYNPKNLTRTVTYNIKTKGSVNVNGNANVSGTAMAGGNWGAKHSGNTLVGELGREIVVDPNTGRWYTVGDNGAEFVDIPKGAIVFNHLQAESLLENGYVAGRAAALMTGTAMVTGGISRKSTINSKVSDGNTTVSPKTSDTANKATKSSNSSNSTTTSKENDPKDFDWIERSIKKIERALSSLKLKADDVYTNFTDRNESLKSQIYTLTDKINICQQAYERYMQQANSIGLSEEWAAKVRDGSIDISSVSDEDLAEKISNYQTWFDKAVEQQNSIFKLIGEQKELENNLFKNVATEYEGNIDNIKHETDVLNSLISRAEINGLMMSTRYYEALANNEKKTFDILSAEKEKLTETLNSSIESGAVQVNSAAWYELQSQINDVTKAIVESKNALADFGKEMRQITWDRFDYMQDTVSQLTDESEFLIDLLGDDLFNDNGSLNKNGNAVMGLHGLSYNVDMQQSLSYAKELQKIESELANNPEDTKLIARKQELLKLQRESILSAEDEKQAMVDLVKDGFDVQLDALQKLIDTYEDSLDSAKDLYEYQQSITEHTKDIAAIEKQLSAYQNDTSEESKAKIQKLKTDLTDAQKDLRDTEYDKYVSDQKELLDNLYTEYEDILNERLDNVDSLISDMIDTVNSNSYSINSTLKSEAGDVGIKLSKEMQSVWTSENQALSDYFSGKNGGIVLSADGYFENLSELTGLHNALDSICSNVNTIMQYASIVAKVDIDPEGSKNQMIQNSLDWFADDNSRNSLASENEKYGKAFGYTKSDGSWYDSDGNLVYSISDDEKIRNVIAKMKSNSAKWSGASDSDRTKLEQQNESYANKIASLSGQSVYKDGNGTWWIGDKELYSYKNGGLVNYTGLAQLDGTPSKPELVLNAKQTENYLAVNDRIRELSKQKLTIQHNYYTPVDYGDMVSLSGITDITKKVNELSKTTNVNSSKSIGDINITIPIEHVDDYNDFVSQLQKDKKFEKFIGSITVDKLAGGSSLEKNKYRW